MHLSLFLNREVDKLTHNDFLYDKTIQVKQRSASVKLITH